MGWFPGHMKKTLDEINEKIKLVDVVIEIVDARMPYSTKNPIIDKVAINREHLIFMTKKDLADNNETKKWIDYYKKNGYKVLAINTFVNGDITAVKRLLGDIKKEILNGKKSKLEDFEMKIMVVGMPNVGKSSFLNSFKGKKSTKVGNTPGVTKNMQWIKTDGGFLLLDTPGVLMSSRKETSRVNNLEILNSIDTSSQDSAELSLKIIDVLKNRYPGLIENRYGVSEDLTPLKILESVAKRRGALIKGGDFDYDRAGKIIVDEFRKGVLGNLTLESPDELDRERI